MHWPMFFVVSCETLIWSQGFVSSLWNRYQWFEWLFPAIALPCLGFQPVRLQQNKVFWTYSGRTYSGPDSETPGTKATNAGFSWYLIFKDGLVAGKVLGSWWPFGLWTPALCCHRAQPFSPGHLDRVKPVLFWTSNLSKVADAKQRQGHSFWARTPCFTC